MHNTATSSSLHPVSEPSRVATHCPYCAFQCGIYLSGPREAIALTGNASFPVNKGALCVKGWHAAELLNHPERLYTPLARNARGELVPATWDEALARIVNAFQEVRQAYGPDAVGIFGGGSLTNEKAYLLGKFARVALGTSQIDYNGRFCMSSAAEASLAAFGIDRGLPFPLEDIPYAEVILLVGSNVAETMPPLGQYFEAQRPNGGKLIVVDPRASVTTHRADLHLRLTPGSDAALANGLLHILVREGMISRSYIQKYTEGFEQVRGQVANYWPALTERITGVPEAVLAQTAYMLGRARSAMILSARGLEQQSQGVNNVLSYINIALALGLPGRAYSGFGSLTGQGNGQGGREHGQKANQLPGYRKITDPEARRYVAQVWGVDEASLPGPGRSAYELLETLGQEGGVRALLVMGSNMLVSAPNALHVQERLKALDFLVVADFFLSETAQLADVVLPTAQWAEEEGTMTNLEGRVIRRRRALVPPPGIRTDNEILCTLAELLGKGEYFDFAEPEEIFAELCRASARGVADYAGMTYEKIEAQNGLFWPCPDPEHAGTIRLFQNGFPTASGRARFHAIRHQLPAEEPDQDFPLYLITGRVLAHYQSGAQTRRVARLRELAPEALVEIHPTTARTYGIWQGDQVRLTTRRGSAQFTVKVTSSIREDTIFAPFHWSGRQSINRLTNPALDAISRMPEFKVCAVRIQRVEADMEV